VRHLDVAIRDESMGRDWTFPHTLQRRPTLGEIADAAAKKAKKEAAKKKKAGNCECQCEVECCVGWHCGY
jgi:hypothetical protein